MDNNERRAVVLPHSLLEALDKYAASKHISKSEAIRKFIEIETVMPIVMKRYMERLIAMQAVSTRTSAAALQCCVSVLAENYIDSATPEEILANALRQSCRITKTKPKSDEEYLREAHEWLSAELDTPNDK